MGIGEGGIWDTHLFDKIWEGIWDTHLFDKGVTLYLA
jgi:hypothetical protein